MKRQKQPRYHQAIEEVLRRVLPPKTTVESGNPGENVIKINRERLDYQFVRNCGLREAREIAAVPHPRPLIICAEQISEAARDTLSSASIGWLLLSGSAASIVTPRIVVSRSGPPEKRPRALGWSTSVIAVAEAILCGIEPTVTSIAKAIDIPLTTSTYALRALTEKGLLSTKVARGRNAQRIVDNPQRFLDEYARAAADKRKDNGIEVGVVWRDTLAGLKEVGKRWTAAGIPWASTGAVAATVLAPYLTSVTSAEVYVEAATIAGLEGVAAKAGLQRLVGGRLRLIPFPTQTTKILAQNSRNTALRVAPWPRVYADLQAQGVRGEEAADHLRNVSLENGLLEFARRLGGHPKPASDGHLKTGQS